MKAALLLVSFRSYLKNVFWPNLCVGSSFQVLDILQYACGLKLGPALTLNQYPIFEMASSVFVKVTLRNRLCGRYVMGRGALRRHPDELYKDSDGTAF